MKASKKGRLTLQKALGARSGQVNILLCCSLLVLLFLRSDIVSYSPEDVYKPRQGPDGVKGKGLRVSEATSVGDSTSCSKAVLATCTSPQMANTSPWQAAGRRVEGFS